MSLDVCMLLTRDRSRLEVIVLVGLPGSGKSTLCSGELSGYTRINQDELGSRSRCIEVASDALESQNSVVIDRTNIDTNQRATWVNLARKFGAFVSCVF